MLSQYDDAERALDWADSTARELGASYDRLRALFHKARLLGNRGRISDALDVLEEAIRLADRVGDRRLAVAPSQYAGLAPLRGAETYSQRSSWTRKRLESRLSSATQRASAIHTSMRRGITWHSASRGAPWSTCRKPNGCTARISGSVGFTTRAWKENSRAIGPCRAISS